VRHILFLQWVARSSVTIASLVGLPRKPHGRTGTHFLRVPVRARRMTATEYFAQLGCDNVTFDKVVLPSLGPPLSSGPAPTISRTRGLIARARR
jgi:hypothetical protein